jgi:hypothetical protein
MAFSPVAPRNKFAISLASQSEESDRENAWSSARACGLENSAGIFQFHGPHAGKNGARPSGNRKREGAKRFAAMRAASGTYVRRKSLLARGFVAFRAAVAAGIFLRIICVALANPAELTWHAVPLLGKKLLTFG